MANNDSVSKARTAVGSRTPGYMKYRPAVATPERFSFPRAVSLSLAPLDPVLLVERYDLPLVHLRITLPWGSAHDPAFCPGLAYATCQMIDEGAGQRSALDLSSALLQQGASLAIWADEDSTVMTLHVLRRNFSAALGILADIILQPHLSAREWGRVRQDLQARALARRTDPARVAHLAFKRALFIEQPYARPVMPLPQQVAQLQLKSLRQFHGQHYQPHSAQLTVAGALKPAELRKLWLKHFAGWSSRGRRSPAGILAEVAPGQYRKREGGHRRRGRLFMVAREGAPQSTVIVGQLGPTRKECAHGSLQVLNTILGGSFTSRLNQCLRERYGFTYGVGSSFSFLRQRGVFSIRTAVESQNTIRALQEILSEVEMLRTEPASSAELTKAKHLVLAEMVRQGETLEGLVEHFAELAFQGLDREDLDAQRQEIEALSPQRLHQLARMTLAPSSELAIVVVGDLSQLAGPLQEVFGPGQMLDSDGQMLTIPRQ